MSTTRYTPEMLCVLNAWLSDRHCPTWKAEEVPHVGLIAATEAGGIAAGFLRQCEGNLAIFDSFVTNPESSSVVRNEALNLLVADLTILAKTIGLDKLIVLTDTASIYQRAEDAGFIHLDQTVMGKQL